MLEKKYYHRRILLRNCTSSTLFCLYFLFLFQISQSSQFPLWPETQNMFVFISKISLKSVSNWKKSNNKVLLLVSQILRGSREPLHRKYYSLWVLLAANQCSNVFGLLFSDNLHLDIKIVAAIKFISGNLWNKVIAIVGWQYM